ncbi:hypothetical protein KOW79_002852 [Hemibagrus wyckioides]|uniref:Uncharacterized protein n=1 Tax=Hemibagrus wyckioides TaxID=337641 RepID=A0A9D3STG9_9TELE|nr:hypothetical protein KOW79_002852 [Hemibagrus wyckioides]
MDLDLTKAMNMARQSEEVKKQQNTLRGDASGIIMHKKAVFFPGCVKVVFRKGPLGYLLQEPTEEARLIKDNPSLPDKSAPKEEELVRRNALAVVSQRGELEDADELESATLNISPSKLQSQSPPTPPSSSERFGLEYVEPGCRPVVLDWEKHKSKSTQAFSPAEQGRTPTAQSSDHPGDHDVTPSPQLESGCVKVMFRKGPLGYLLQEPTEEARLIKDNPSLPDKSAPKEEELVRRNALAVIIMHKKAVFFPGCVKVVFRKGPLGYLLQEPTEEARLIKDNPSLPDKSAPKEEELVRRNALAVVSQRGELEDADELESATLNISPSKLQSQSPPTPPSSSERFGLEYVEPGCRPVVLDWEKHKSKSTQAFSPAEQGRTPTAQSSDHPGDHDVTPSPQLESGCVKVVFRKGPLGYLLQEPTEEARLIKDNPSLPDKSAPKEEELVRRNALAVEEAAGVFTADTTIVVCTGAQFC